jgi:hypothetical protein
VRRPTRKAAAITASATTAPAISAQARVADFGSATGTATSVAVPDCAVDTAAFVREESLSRFRRFKSARSSAAVW